MARVLIPLAVVVFSAGCTPNLKTLRTRAAYDLNCPESKIETTKLSGEVYGVSGCGKRATYVNSPTSYNDWILNSDQQESK